MGLNLFDFPADLSPWQGEWQKCQIRSVRWRPKLIIKQQVWCTNVHMLITDEGKCHIIVSICALCVFVWICGAYFHSLTVAFFKLSHVGVQRIKSWRGGLVPSQFFSSSSLKSID